MLDPFGDEPRDLVGGEEYGGEAKGQQRLDLLAAHAHGAVDAKEDWWARRSQERRKQAV